MHPTDPQPPDDHFDQGMRARRDGATLHDNPYAAGSAERRDWNAGFCATVTADEEVDLPRDDDDPKGRATG